MKPLIAHRAGVGFSARVMQWQHLRFSRVTISDPVLIVVRSGRKQIRAPGFDCVLEAGEAVALAADHAFDITNTPGNGSYQADWLVWDTAILASFVARKPDSATIQVGGVLGRLPYPALDAFDIALNAVRRPDALPDEIARHRLEEMLIWLEDLAGRFDFKEPTSMTHKVRRLVLSAPDGDWTTSEVVSRVAASEATLRRRLAEEGTSLVTLVADIRMSHAMQLLLSTDLPISRIALDVGYESQSRFAIRFRQRFGFAPSAVRGHHRSPQAADAVAT